MLGAEDISSSEHSYRANVISPFLQMKKVNFRRISDLAQTLIVVNKWQNSRIAKSCLFGIKIAHFNSKYVILIKKMVN